MSPDKTSAMMASRVPVSRTFISNLLLKHTRVLVAEEYLKILENDWLGNDAKVLELFTKALRMNDWEKISKISKYLFLSFLE